MRRKGHYLGVLFFLFFSKLVYEDNSKCHYNVKVWVKKTLSWKILNWRKPTKPFVILRLQFFLFSSWTILIPNSFCLLTCLIFLYKARLTLLQTKITLAWLLSPCWVSLQNNFPSQIMKLLHLKLKLSVTIYCVILLMSRSRISWK